MKWFISLPGAVGNPAQLGVGLKKFFSNFFMELIFLYFLYFCPFWQRRKTLKKRLSCVLGQRLKLPTFRSERYALCQHATKTFGLHTWQMWLFNPSSHTKPSKHGWARFDTPPDMSFSFFYLPFFLTKEFCNECARIVRIVHIVSFLLKQAFDNMCVANSMNQKVPCP